MTWTQETLGRAQDIIARYPQKRSAVMPLLYLAMAEEGGDLLPRRLYRPLRPAAEDVRAGRIPEVLEEVGLHRLGNRRVHGGRRVVVEVDHGRSLVVGALISGV